MVSSNMIQQTVICVEVMYAFLLVELTPRTVGFVDRSDRLQTIVPWEFINGFQLLDHDMTGNVGIAILNPNF